MEGSDANEDSCADAYAFLFRQHLIDTQRHLLGKSDDDLSPSHERETGPWTSAEKDAFFHGLAIYSRLRPDLVAASVGTKTAFDVCAYINFLDSSLLKISNPPARNIMEGAMEVSDIWIQQEERAAKHLIALEANWEEAWAEKESSRQGTKSSAVIEHSPLSKGEVAVDVDDLRGRQEALLSRLSLEHLRVMEAILKEAEAGSSDLAIGCHAEDQARHSPSPSLAAHQPDNTTAFANVIHPNQPHLSEVTARSPSIPRTVPGEGMAPILALISPTLDVVCPTALLHNAPSVPRSASPLPDEEILLSLSPASRRRFKKRLYMRRKRALTTGKTASLAVGKIRPGRKTKENDSAAKTLLCSASSRRKSRDRSIAVDSDSDGAGDDCEDISVVNSVSDQETCSDDDHCQQHPRTKYPKGGLKKFYKIKREFSSNGIDAVALADGQLGLFHHSALGHLMMIYQSGYGDVSGDIASAISADTIRLMTDIVVEFVTEVIARTIVLREQERHMKEESKVYGSNLDEVTINAINPVLDMLGMRGSTKGKYFAHLLGEDNPETEHEGSDGIRADSPTEVEYPSEGHRDGDNDLHVDLTPPPIYLPVNLPRELHPPLIHIPGVSLPCHGWSSPRGPSIEESLLPLNVDIGALECELAEEMELDEADGILARGYEIELWKQINFPRHVSQSSAPE